jgi:hypothetical protein
MFVWTKMGTLPPKKYLYRERVVRVTLAEWKQIGEKEFWISAAAITKKYELPYFRTLNFLKRLATDGVITWRQVRPLRRTQSDFRLTPDGEKILRSELDYASSI